MAGRPEKNKPANAADAGDPQGKIIDASVKLFAQKGFAGTGIREIAHEAGVNVAMISYYFDGKVGLLKEILQRFFTEYESILVAAGEDSLPIEKSVEKLVERIVALVRRNTDLALVVYNELPLEIPELMDLKVAFVGRMMSRMQRFWDKLGWKGTDFARMSMIGPMLLSGVLTHFRIQPVLGRVGKVTFDDRFYETYTHTMAHFFLYGVTGLSGPTKMRGGKAL